MYIEARPELHLIMGWGERENEISFSPGNKDRPWWSKNNPTTEPPHSPPPHFHPPVCLFLQFLKRHRAFSHPWPSLVFISPWRQYHPLAAQAQDPGASLSLLLLLSELLLSSFPKTDEPIHFALSMSQHPGSSCLLLSLLLPFSIRSSQGSFWKKDVWDEGAKCIPCNSGEQKGDWSQFWAPFHLQSRQLTILSWYWDWLNGFSGKLQHQYLHLCPLKLAHLFWALSALPLLSWACECHLVPNDLVCISESVTVISQKNAWHLLCK